ncbi:hypothetical protein OB955_21270 [Halobacteria archaeon AArc-m2/3/4]|uniref:Uncharacterized protein n=1 Tax=Natronoglomus mannanivorans TaxID=2979990 RepID=A0ABT2QJW6_9EURY|nr:hypothetical protein [Halobacteria archaeon AArc-m2/3/4]
MADQTSEERFDTPHHTTTVSTESCFSVESLFHDPSDRFDWILD